MSDQPFMIGDWAQWSVIPERTVIGCWYHGKTTIACDSPFASRIIHDGRGCFHVCKAHCDWRATTSVMAGHHHCPEGAQ